MNVFLTAVFAFFAFYGAVHMIFALITSCRVKEFDNSDLKYTVITVKNQQNNVEGIIRSEVWRSLKLSGGTNIPQIVVIDLGSEDETPAILKKLEMEYEFIHVTNKEGYINVVKDY